MFSRYATLLAFATRLLAPSLEWWNATNTTARSYETAPPVRISKFGSLSLPSNYLPQTTVGYWSLCGWLHSPKHAFAYGSAGVHSFSGHVAYCPKSLDFVGTGFKGTPFNIRPWYVLPLFAFLGCWHQRNFNILSPQDHAFNILRRLLLERWPPVVPHGDIRCSHFPCLFWFKLRHGDGSATEAWRSIRSLLLRVLPTWQRITMEITPVHWGILRQLEFWGFFVWSPQRDTLTILYSGLPWSSSPLLQICWWACILQPWSSKKVSVCNPVLWIYNLNLFLQALLQSPCPHRPGWSIHTDSTDIASSELVK